MALRKRPIPLAFGTGVHTGLQCLLETGDIEQAVTVGHKEFSEEAQTRGLELQPNEDSLFVYNEQRHLLEALLRAWFLVRWPKFQEEYEILDVELEELWRLAENKGFMARADGVLRSRADGSLYILSFKTAKSFDRKIESMGRSDIQGISELVAVEGRLGERVQGIQMEYLVKGSRNEYPKGSGLYRTYSPLVHPWIGPQGRMAWSWSWSDLDGNHTLGGKYRQVNIWEQMSIKGWIENLASGQVQPEAGSCLGNYIQSPLPYNRNRGEIDSWKIQAEVEADEMQNKSQIVEEMRKNEDLAAFSYALDRNFIQRRHSCEFPTKCPMYDICFGSAGPEPEEDPRFTWREPHHLMEQAVMEARDAKKEQAQES